MSPEKPKKPWPSFDSDEEMEAWFDTADFGEYDFSQFEPAQFVLRKKDARVNMRLPTTQLTAVKAAAAYEGMPYQRFIRKAISEALEKSFREAGKQETARQKIQKKAS
jgi:predicted DNA binding CopG/RHH family protein